MWRGLIVLVALPWLAGCSDMPDGIACTAIAVPSLSITVQDQATGARVCDATVTAVEGAFRESLTVFGDGGSCAYSGPYERAGTYAVEASRAGYQTETVTGIRVTSDVCHVQTRSVTIALRR
jgi:hypothetical protein